MNNFNEYPEEQSYVVKDDKSSDKKGYLLIAVLILKGLSIRHRLLKMKQHSRLQ